MKKVYPYIGLTALLFATMEVTLKVSSQNFDSFQLTFLRFLIGGLILLPLGLAEKKKKDVTITRGDWLWMALLGVVGISISMVFFQLGIEYSNASTAAVLFSANPLIIMGLAHLFTTDKMNGKKAIAGLLGLIGILFMIRFWDIQEGNNVIGLTFTILAALIFAIYSLMSKRKMARLGNFLQTGISFLLGSGALLIFLLLTDRPVLEGVYSHMPLVVYVGVFVTGVGYWSFFQAIKVANATTASVSFLLKVAIAPIFAIIFLGEEILGSTIIGILLIMTASVIKLREDGKKSK